MHAVTTWSHTPYKQIVNDKTEIYICRVAPTENSVVIEWLPLQGTDSYTVNYKVRGGQEYTAVSVAGTSFEIHGLSDAFDYVMFVSRGEQKSKVRLVRPSDVTGTVVNYLHPEDKSYEFSGSYLSSPSFLRLPDGALLASCDVFGKNTPQNLTLIFRSEDNGQSWHYSCELFPCFWGKLFLHGGDVYMLANSNEYGDLLIGRSCDGGRTFSLPNVLFRSSCSRSEGGLHKNAVPVTPCDGRLWTSIEYGTWEKGGKFHYMLLSADEKSDLLSPSSWVLSEPCVYDGNWEGAAVGLTRGAIEGNTVIGPDGRLMCMLRYEIAKCTPAYGLALLLSADTKEPEKSMKFEKFVKFTGNKSKFDVIRDEVTGKYLSIANRIRSDECAEHRNLLSFYVSDDLDNWRVVCDLIDHTDLDPRKVGAQYVDFQICGDDILYLCRQGHGGAHSYHDSNYITFHKIENFRRTANLS